MVPSPWGEAAKGILHVEKVPYVATRLSTEMPAVVEWTGHSSAPIAVYNDDKPRTGWAEILLLAERLAAQPSLLPADAEERALVFGLSHEICGEDGLGWARRLEGIHAAMNGQGGFPLAVAKYLAPKYGYDPVAGASAGARVVQLLQMLAQRLQRQRATGSSYLVGDSLTAVDIYFATFMALFAPLPQEQCAIPDEFRAAFETMDEATRAAFDPILLDHRDAIYRDHLELPLTL
jgi:glutathione S-transferase